MFLRFEEHFVYVFIKSCEFLLNYEHVVLSRPCEVCEQTCFVPVEDDC